MNFKLGELFCGPGGIGYAAITTKIANPDYKILHAWANDYDKDTCATFVDNIAKKENTVICQDVRKLVYAKIKMLSIEFQNHISQRCVHAGKPLKIPSFQKTLKTMK